MSTYHYGVMPRQHIGHPTGAKRSCIIKSYGWEWDEFTEALRLFPTEWGWHDRLRHAQTWASICGHDTSILGKQQDAYQWATGPLG